MASEGEEGEGVQNRAGLGKAKGTWERVGRKAMQGCVSRALSSVSKAGREESELRATFA